MQIVLTTAGIALLQSQQGPVLVDRCVFGDAYGYTPSPADSNIHGNPLVTVKPNKPLPLNGNVYLYTSLLDYNSGPYNGIGEAGLFAGDVLFALAVSTEPHAKPQGTELRLDAYLQIQGTNYEMWINAIPSDNQFRMAVLQSPDQLPTAQQAWPNAYVLQAGGSYDASLAYTDRGRLWSFAAWRPAKNIPIKSVKQSSVTVDKSQLTSDMTPTYFGSIISQISSGVIAGTCRIVSSLVVSGNDATFNFVTPFAKMPVVGDTIVIYVRTIEDTGPEYILPPATNTTLGGVIVGTGLGVQPDGTLSANVTSVAGRTGNIDIKAADVAGLATVATTGSYNDLVGKPGPYVLPKATSTTLGGIKVGDTLSITPDGVLNAIGYSLPPATASTLGGVKIGTNINVAGDGTISVDPAAVAKVKTVNSQAPDVNGNINVIPYSTTGTGEPVIGATDSQGKTAFKRIVAGSNITVTQDASSNILIQAPSVVKSVNGIQPDSLGNVNYNPTLPGATFAFGHTAQPNGGRGIDKGSWYLFDTSAGGVTKYGGLSLSAIGSGTDKGRFTIPSGLYFVSFNANVLVDSGTVSDTFDLPAQVIVSMMNSDTGFPGPYQWSVQYRPNYVTLKAQSFPNGTQLGSVNASGVVSMGGRVNTCALGFKKVTGSVNNTTLILQGYCVILKIG